MLSLPANMRGDENAMKIIEEIVLPNGLKLTILDLSREIAADTVKVEVVFKTDVDLQESFFSGRQDYELVESVFGNKLVYEYTTEKTFVPKADGDLIREELVNRFKNNSLYYLGLQNFAEKMARARLRDIKKDPYKYQQKQIIDHDQL